MTESHKCLRCGAELPADAPGGHCIFCLLQLGLAADEPAAPDAESPATIRIVPPGQMATENPGDRIGRYKLLQQIGEGGCGVVYMAQQEEPVRRKVALKVIKLGMDTKQVIARFEAERQALALMDHPNIARVLDAGATEAGRPYFVMELVRGIKITDYCDQQRLSTRQRLDLFVQVCQAVQHAHQKGIIHRDLKPSNILVTEQDGKAVPKVIDFGIAKATTAAPLTDKTLFTAFDQFIGTPAYMSPEQAGLGGLDIDTRSDIYSLGVLLYELLTGKPPFDSAALRRSAIDEILRTIREQEPPRPSACLTTLTEQELTMVAQRHQSEPAKFSNLLRGDLDWIVMKTLEKDRARRYETANGLAADVNRHLNNEPVVARPPGTYYRLEKAIRRNRTAFATAAAIMILLIVGIVASTSEAVRATRAEREENHLREEAQHSQATAEADEKAARDETAKTKQVVLFLEAMLKGVGPKVAMGRDTTLLREILDQTAPRLNRELPGQPQVEADLRTTLGVVYFDLGDYAKAEAMHREALRLRRAVYGAGHPDIAISLDNLGETLRVEGREKEALPLVREGLDMRRKLLGNETLELATSLIHYSRLNRLGEREDAAGESVLREAVAIRRKLLGDQHPAYAGALCSLGVNLRGQCKFTEAAAAFREALAIQKKALGDDHPETALSMSNLGLTLEWQGNLAEAEVELREALKIQRKILGNEHSGVAWTLDWLARVYIQEGRLAEAEARLRESVVIRQRLGNPRAITMTILTSVLERQGKLAEAEGMSAQIESAFRERAEHGQLHAGELDSIAWLLATSPDPKLRDGSRAVRYAEKAVMAANGKDPEYLDTLAAAYAETGQFDKAVQVEREAIALAPDERLKRGGEFRLNFYQTNSPCREDFSPEVLGRIIEYR